MHIYVGVLEMQNISNMIPIKMLKIFIYWKNDNVKIYSKLHWKQYTHAEQIYEIAMSLFPQSENIQIWKAFCNYEQNNAEYLLLVCKCKPSQHSWMNGVLKGY